MAALLRVEALTAGYGDEGRRPLPPVVDDVDLEVGRGELFTLLGPSGCGKSTLLRAVAGLHRPRGGRISIDGATVFDADGPVDVAPNKRRVGMVFQSHAIWPHLDVFANAAFPLTAVPRRRRLPVAEIRARVHQVLEQVELGGLADRPASRLSGGQQQRLALARALVGEPALLLLDEPLSNLDAPLRVSMRLELKRLQRELGVTVLFVTHDQDEALSISSAVGVMQDGRLVQVGRPEELYQRPADPFVAAFVGRANLVPGRADGAAVVSPVLGHIAAVEAGAAGAVEVLAVVRPERVELSPPGPVVGANRWIAVVREVAFRGDVLDVVVAVGGLALDVRVAPDGDALLAPGTEVLVHVPPDAVRIVPA